MIDRKLVAKADLYARSVSSMLTQLYHAQRDGIDATEIEHRLFEIDSDLTQLVLMIDDLRGELYAHQQIEDSKHI